MECNSPGVAMVMCESGPSAKQATVLGCSVCSQFLVLPCVTCVTSTSICSFFGKKRRMTSLGVDSGMPSLMDDVVVAFLTRCCQAVAVVCVSPIVMRTGLSSVPSSGMLISLKALWLSCSQSLLPPESVTHLEEITRSWLCDLSFHQGLFLMWFSWLKPWSCMRPLFDGGVVRGISFVIVIGSNFSAIP